MSNNRLSYFSDSRFLWLFASLCALSLNFIAVFFFQGYLNLAPCEYCVYIRFELLMVSIGFFIGFIAPKNLLFKALGLIVTIIFLIRGLLASITLKDITFKAQNIDDSNPFMSTCSINDVHFLFNLPLHKWLPDYFLPTAICGEDTWQFLSLNMAEWMIVIFSTFITVLSMVLVIDLYRYFLNKNR